MDCEILILEVQERPEIWDITHKSHHNRSMLDKLWDDIRRKVGSSKDKCRKKWKYMKDRYRSELRKERIFVKSGKGDINDFKSSFNYFPNMEFMRKQMWLGKTEDRFYDYPMIELDQPLEECEDVHTTGNIYEQNYQNEHTEENLYDGGASTNYRIPVIQSATSINDPIEYKVPAVTLKLHKKVNKRKIAKKFLLIEERKAELLEKIESATNQVKDTDNLLFFKSLLGFMESFTPAQNLRVRNKIQSIIIDEINASVNNYPTRNNKIRY